MLFTKTREALKVWREVKLYLAQHKNVLEKDFLSLSEAKKAYDITREQASKLRKVCGNNYFLDKKIWEAWKYFDRLHVKIFCQICEI